MEKIKLLIPEPEGKVKNYAGNIFLSQFAETQHSIILPSDYIELINHYGAGIYGKMIYISSYFGKYSIFQQQKKHRDFFCSMLKNFPERKDIAGYPVFPDRNGLLVMGGDENGCNLMWLTEGLPHQWAILFFDEYMQNESRYEMPITEFLYRWLIGELHPKCLEGTLHDGDPIIPCERTPMFSPDKI